MDITPEIIEALAILREEAKYQEGAGHPVMEAFRKLDDAGVFSALDDAAHVEEPVPAPRAKTPHWVRSYSVSGVRAYEVVNLKGVCVGNSFNSWAEAQEYADHLNTEVALALTPRPTLEELRRDLSGRMLDELVYAARTGWQGEAPFINNRNTENALLRRGLITYEYGDKSFASARVNGYRNPILTVAGWAVTGIERPADAGRYSLEDALVEAYDSSVSDAWKMSRNSGVCRWEGPKLGFVPSLHYAARTA